jgi:hypothetical protein
VSVPAFPEMPNYEPYVGELLKLAGAKPGARADLVNSLESARGDIYFARIKQARPPTRLLKQLENHLRLTISLLEELEKYPIRAHVNFEKYVAGGGIADAFTTQELFKLGLAAISLLPRNPKPSYGPQELPPGGKLVAVNVKEVLRSIQYQIKQGRPKLGQPPKEDQAAAVLCAKDFFDNHSPYGLSSDAFARFCERFYYAASGTAADGKLDYAVKQARKQRRLVG